MTNRTRTYLLLEERLGKSLADHVASARQDGMSWNGLALDLHKRTDVAVTSETLRMWFYTDDRESRTQVGA